MPTGLFGLSDTEPGAPRLEGVGVLRRGLARLVDLGVLQLTVGLAAVLAILLTFGLEIFLGPSVWVAIERFTAQDPGLGSRLWGIVVGFTGLTVMHTLCEGLHGSTIGKRLCGITVVSDEGAHARMGAALKRSLGFLVDQLFFGLVGAHRIHNDPQAQRVGDSWAGTMVIRLNALDPPARRSTGRFLVATLVGLAATLVVAYFGFTAQIVHGARAAARDRIEIVDIALEPDRPLRPGEGATAIIEVRYELRSAPSGSVRLFVGDRGEYLPLGDGAAVRRGGRRTTLREQVRVPATPTAPGSFVLSFALALYPAQNVEQNSAYAGYDVQLIACEPSVPDQLCILRGLRG